MTSRPIPQHLDVLLHGEAIGTLQQRSGGRMRFTFNEATIGRHGIGAIVVSVSLPVREATYPPAAATPWFSGLLPDESLWRQIGVRLGRGGARPYDLLALLGGDVAGAIQLVDPDAEADDPSASGPDIAWLSPDGLAAELDGLATSPLGLGATGRRVSLAGAQEKLVVVREGPRHGIPLNGRPSTHILKPDSARFPGAARSEALCMEAARAAGLSVAATTLENIADRDILCVERFDRTVATGRLQRLHQEDICQALGLMPQDRYEDSGGPGLTDCLRLLTHSTRAGADRLEFLRRAVFNWLVGNSDAHGKNHALLYHTAGLCLAPAYDVLATEAFVDDPHLAMAIGGEWDPNQVTRAAWTAALEAADIGPKTITLLERFARQAVASLDQLADSKLWRTDPDTTAPVLERARKRARLLAG